MVVKERTLTLEGLRRLIICRESNPLVRNVNHRPLNLVFL